MKDSTSEFFRASYSVKLRAGAETETTTKQEKLKHEKDLHRNCPCFAEIIKKTQKAGTTDRIKKR